MYHKEPKRKEVEEVVAVMKERRSLMFCLRVDVTFFLLFYFSFFSFLSFLSFSLCAVVF